MNLVEITDPHDPRLRDYTQLRESSLRRSLEAAEGLFIAEGEKVIRRSFEAGLRPRSVMLAPRWLDGLRDHLAQYPDVPVYLVTEQLAEQVTGFHVHRGALGSFVRPVPTPVADLLSSRRLVVLEDIVDHANVGAVIRSAAGLGWDGVLLAPRAADPLYRRAIKVSMGASLTMPWARFEDWANAVDGLNAAGFHTIALALSEDAHDLAEVAADFGADEKVAILLGTEGDGLSRRWQESARTVAMMPMARGVDSLNVAAAAAVACWELRPRRHEH